MRHVVRLLLVSPIQHVGFCASKPAESRDTPPHAHATGTAAEKVTRDPGLIFASAHTHTHTHKAFIGLESSHERGPGNLSDGRAET